MLAVRLFLPRRDTMAAAETLRLEQRPVDRWLGSYSEDHRNATNVAIHWICVPAILWCVIAALWTIPVPAWLGRPGLWAGVGMFAALMFYLRLSRKLGYGMLFAFVALGLITEGLYRVLGPGQLLIAAGAVFVLAWIAQFVGHHIEGKRPSFFTDLAYLLIGPAWIVSKLMRRAGIGL
jgi:uncharacterized membrane protein YGL010W